MYAPADQYVPQCTPHTRSLRRPLIAWAMMAAAALAVVGLIVAAPLALAHGYNALAHPIYDVFGYLCHQLPGRSFQLEGHSFAVCARCTGLYAGLAIAVLCYPLVRSLRDARSPRRMWLLLAAVPVTIDFALGFFNIWQNTHLSRFITGALLGGACALYIVPGMLDLSRTVWQRLFARRSADDAREAASRPIAHG
jgi:uncharacterized membrane protein